MGGGTPLAMMEVARAARLHPTTAVAQLVWQIVWQDPHEDATIDHWRGECCGRILTCQEVAMMVGSIASGLSPIFYTAPGQIDNCQTA